jgi:hypothetical protein
MTQKQFLVDALNFGNRLLREVIPDATLVVNPDKFQKKVEDSKMVFMKTCESWVEIWFRIDSFTNEEIAGIKKFLKGKARKLKSESGVLRWRLKK